MPVGLGETHVGDVMLGGQPPTSDVEPLARVYPDDQRRLLTERDAHAAPAAAVVENAIQVRDPGALKIAQELRATPVFEDRVVIVGAKPDRTVSLDGVVVDGSQAPSDDHTWAAHGRIAANYSR